MKIFIFFCFIFQSLFAFSQSQERSALAVINPKTHGYVNGIRLDSIDADYGQLGGRKKLTVTDNNGSALIFARTSLTFLLNFFYFNGWELAHSYHDYSEKSEVFIFKKRRQI